MRTPRRLLVSAVALTSLLALSPSAGASAEDQSARMPLGPSTLETKAGTPETLAEGVTYQKYWQGEAKDFWSVWLEIPIAGKPSSWQVGEKSHAERLVKELTDKGFAGRVTTFDAPSTTDTPELKPMGHTVRVGNFKPEQAAEAERLKNWLKDAGYPGRVVYTAEDGKDSSGPWEVRVVKVAPGAAVSLEAVHGADVQTAETVRDMAKLSKALVAVNGSEFDISTGPGHPGYNGDPQGLYLQNDNLLSEANNGRTALLLESPGVHARVAEITTRTQVKAADGASRAVDGINRLPGRILGCGGIGGDIREPDKVPALAPWRNTVCTDTDEVVVFRPEWGSTTPPPLSALTDSIDVVMDGNWVVQSTRSPAGGPIPSGSRVLQGIGAGAAWLRTHALPQTKLTPTTSVLDSEGKSVTSPTTTLSAVAGGGPALVRNGQVFINTTANGMTNVKGEPNNNVVQRHPRTLAGVTAAGEVLLVTIDGRRPETSVGVTLHEAAEVMKWLGAKDALSLGVGGDTTLIAQGILYNNPMDVWGTQTLERKVGTAVVIKPTN
ncbi:phosphodiester glycosidase family protein [Streptomyces sp. NPDC058401]|uniref:phosphodiester glycosidase family protein n=1 Tax=Streptomyces sp. NPDC058401 TaxID=3346480 RepID=UPI00364E0EDA